MGDRKIDVIDCEERRWNNGKPYYCEVCGLGFDEYMACEEPHCKLESDEQAETRAKDQQGWAWPINARKAHYFVFGRSLCGNWIFLGKRQSQGDPDKESPDDCRACRRAYDERRAKSK